MIAMAMGSPNYLDPDLCEFYIPSVITPNSDGDNDALFIPGLQYFNNYKFTVFNSMGNKVYEVENSNVNFNGSTSGTVVWSTTGGLPSGTYYYVLDIRPNKWMQTGYIFISTLTMKKHFLYTILVLFLSLDVASQSHPSLNNYLFNPVSISPSYAGRLSGYYFCGSRSALGWHRRSTRNLRS